MIEIHKKGEEYWKLRFNKDKYLYLSTSEIIELKYFLQDYDLPLSSK